MIDNKNSEIILCKGIKMDRNYENVLSYSESDMVTLCRNNKIYEADNYTFVEKEKNKIVISHPYSSAMYSNYVAFRNSRFGNKWIFAWVTNVELINIGSTQITFEVDVWSTWYSNFTIGKAFIEREHVEDDTVGKHTIPEGLETGEYIAQIKNNTNSDPNITNMYYLSNVVIVAGVTTTGLDNYSIPQRAQQSQYNGVYSGLYYLAFKTPRDFNLYLDEVHKNISDDNIVTLFVCPYEMCDFVSSDWDSTTYDFEFAFVPTSTTEKNLGDIGYPKADHLDNDYIPVNNKLLVFPYCFLNVTNNAGGVCDYHYELFNGNSCGFNLKGSLGVGCSIKMYPVDYAVKGIGSNTLGNKLHSIEASKLPTCTWSNDAYTNWLTSQAVNIPLNLGSSLLNISSGIATGQASNVVGGFTGILGQVASIYEHSLQPPIAKGGTNQADLNFAQRNTFNIYPMSIKKEYAIVIDRYLSRFGYKVNEVKTPNLNSRTQFNFIKVGGMDELIYGDIPANDLEKINSICRKGVTIFHNYSTFGDYTQTNSIVTP
jgi:hypothetical protein